MEDVIMISDIDEIPNPEIIRNLKKTDFRMYQKNGNYSVVRQMAGVYNTMGYKVF